jgi:hypothetical protein
VLEIIPNCDNFDEDTYTLKYMEKYGINNVRGGVWCKLHLDENELSFIKKKINSATDKCYICGKNGHFAKECYFKTTIPSEKIEDLKDDKIKVFSCSYCNKEFNTLKSATCHENLYCKSKNNKTEHHTSNSYDKTIITCNKSVNCKSENNKIKHENICFKCGREGHYASNCYAKTIIC